MKFNVNQQELQQAQQMQRKMMEIDKKLNEMEVTGSVSGGLVTITMTGKGDVKGVKIDSQSFTSSIGDNKSVTLDFSAQIGGPNQVGMGVFMSGSHIGTIGW